MKLAPRRRAGSQGVIATGAGQLHLYYTMSCHSCQVGQMSVLMVTNVRVLMTVIPLTIRALSVIIKAL